MKKLLYFVTFLGALILFTACSKDQDIYRPKQNYIRFGSSVKWVTPIKPLSTIKKTESKR